MNTRSTKRSQPTVTTAATARSALLCLLCLVAVLVATPAAGASDSVFDITDFGARADGVTDDSDAVRAAFAAMPTGGVLRFPPGTVRMEQPLVINKNGVTIQGYGELATTIETHGNTAFIIDEFLPGARMIRNLTMQDFGLEDNSESVDSVGIESLAYVLIGRLRRLRVESFGAYGVRILGSLNFTVEDCFFANSQDGSTGSALQIGPHPEIGVSTTLGLYRNFFADSVPGAAAALHLVDVHTVTAVGNSFADALPATDAPAIRCEATAGSVANNHTFMNTHIDDYPAGAWQMHDVTQASFVGCTGVRPTFTWDKVTDSLARHALELQSGESGVLRSAGRLVLSNHSGANDYDPSAAVKLEPLVDGELAHDALSSESATEGAFSYRAHWAKNLFGQPREIARVGVRQGAPSPVSPGATWRALLTAEHSERLEVKLEATGGGDFVVYNGDIEVTGGGNGLICTSPDGFVRKRIALSDDGEIIVTDP